MTRTSEPSFFNQAISSVATNLGSGVFKAILRYFATGIANSAPLPMLAGQRCITLFCFV
jgi:hypothetical protein